MDWDSVASDSRVQPGHPRDLAIPSQTKTAETGLAPAAAAAETEKETHEDVKPQEELHYMPGWTGPLIAVGVCGTILACGIAGCRCTKCNDYDQLR